MATIALGIVGAGIGSAFGNPMLGWSVGTLVGGMIDGPHVKGTNSGRLSDLRVMGSQYGAPIPQVWGAFRTGGNIIWATDLVEHAASSKAPGKGLKRPTNKSYTYTVSMAVAVCRGPVGRVKRIWAEDRVIYDADDATVVCPATSVTCYVGNEVQTPDPYILGRMTNAPAYRGLCYIVFQDLNLAQWGNRVPAMTFEVDANGGTVTVATILSDIFQQAGLGVSQFDVTAGTSVVTGFFLSQRQSVGRQIEHLLNAYFYDLIEIDGILKLVARGGSSSVTVPVGDLGARLRSTGGTSANPLTKVHVKRIQDIELPQRLELSYFSRSTLYNLMTHSSVRFTKVHQMKRALQFPLVLTEAAARAMVEKLMYRHWVEREHFEFFLPPKYLQYAPSDIMMLPVGSQSLRVRITNQDTSLFGAIKFTAVLDDLTLLTQSLSADSPQTVTIPAQGVTTQAIPWSLNALVDADATSSGFYVGAAGTESSRDWPGCVIYWSRDGGSTYQVLDSIIDAMQYGVVNGVVPAPAATVGTSIFDTGSTVTVTMTSGTPTTTTDADVLGGANIALVGSEIIQFATVTPTGTPNQYNLTRLLRGRRGTDAYWSSHLNGENFIILSVGSILRKALDESFRGKVIYLKAVTSDSTLAATTAVTVTISGDEWKCYSPVQGAGTRDGSLNLTATWIRRARSGSELRDAHDVDLPETSELYDVEVMDSPSGSIVERTFSSLTSATMTYTAAQQTTDFGSTQSSITLKVYEIGKYGRGFVYKFTV